MNVLAIGTHPEDVEIAFGGTLARCVKRGFETIKKFYSGKPENSSLVVAQRDRLRWGDIVWSAITEAVRDLGMKL